MCVFYSYLFVKQMLMCIDLENAFCKVSEYL